MSAHYDALTTGLWRALSKQNPEFTIDKIHQATQECPIESTTVTRDVIKAYGLKIKTILENLEKKQKHAHHTYHDTHISTRTIRVVVDGHDRDVRKYPTLGYFRFHLGDNLNDQIVPGEKRSGFVDDDTYVNITHIVIKEIIFPRLVCHPESTDTIVDVRTFPYIVVHLEQANMNSVRASNSIISESLGVATFCNESCGSEYVYLDTKLSLETTFDPPQRLRSLTFRFLFPSGTEVKFPKTSATFLGDHPVIRHPVKSNGSEYDQQLILGLELTIQEKQLKFSHAQHAHHRPFAI